MALKNRWGLIIALLSIVFYGCASLQESPIEERQIQKVYEVPGASQKQIYDKALEWMAKTYISSKDVIQLKDPDNGKIIGKGVTSYASLMIPIPCEYIITIESKDGRMRIICDQFNALVGEYHTDRQPLKLESDVSQVKQNLSGLMDNLFAFVSDKKKDNW